MTSLLHVKRKAEGNLQTRPARQSRYNCIDKPSPSVIGRIAEEGSLNFIIRNNGPRRLYVKPIAWTSDHLQLLECTFDFENASLKRKPKPSQKFSSTCGKDSSPSQAGRSQQSQDAIDAKESLFDRGLYIVKKMPFGRFSMLTIYILKDRNTFLFASISGKLHGLPTGGVFASSAGPSSLAYISFATIQEIRKHHFRGVKNAAHPFTAEVRGDLWDIESPQLAQDPYLVAILIALAQDQRRHQQRKVQDTDTTKDVALPEKGAVSCQGIKPKGPSTTQSIKIQVLAVYGPVARYLYVYTAIISAEFLDKFDKP